MKKLIIMLLVIAVLLVGCAQKATPEPVELVVEEVIEELPLFRYVNFKIYDPVYVGMDKGFFEECGVRVELAADLLAGPTAIQAVAAGSADGGASSIAALVNANAAGLPVQGVIDIQSTIGEDQGDRTQALQRWYVRSDSDIDGWGDLEGKDYAVNLWRSSFHYTSLMGLAQNDIDEDSINWVLLSFDKQIPALAEGAVDVIGLMQPYQTYAEQLYGDEFKELHNDRDDIFGGSMNVSLIFLNRVWAEYNPEAAEAFVCGVRESINWIEANQDEARPIISKYTEIPVESIADYHFTENGHVIAKDIQMWIDFMLERGDITADWLDPEMVGSDYLNVAE